MPFVRKGSVTITTATGGGATGYIVDGNGSNFTGTLRALRYTKTDFASTTDFTITDERTGESLWVQSNVNASALKHPVAPVHTTTSGAAIADVYVAPSLVGSRIKVVVAQGGNTKTGDFEAVVE